MWVILEYGVSNNFFFIEVFAKIDLIRSLGSLFF